MGTPEQLQEYKDILDGYESTFEPYMCIVAVIKEGENVIVVIGTLDLIFQKPDKGDSKDVCMAGKKARIGNVVVVKLARGQGVASRMVKFAIEIAKKKKGVPQMFIKPDLDNELAQAPYKKMGFMTSSSSQSMVRRNDKDNLPVQENPSRHVARFVQVTPSSLN